MAAWGLFLIVGWLLLHLQLSLKLRFYSHFCQGSFLPSARIPVERAKVYFLALSFQKRAYQMRPFPDFFLNRVNGQRMTYSSASKVSLLVSLGEGNFWSTGGWSVDLVFMVDYCRKPPTPIYYWIRGRLEKSRYCRSF